VFCFFVAHWLARNIHKTEAQAAVKVLGSRLDHDVSANVFIFLSHLTDHPVVLQEMRAAAAGLMSNAKLATMTDDIQPLNELNSPENFFSLPSTTPEVNRRLLQDAQDDELASRRSEGSQDGRKVKALPDL